MCTDEGRVRRPLIMVDKGVPQVTRQSISSLESGTLKFRDLLSVGAVEFLDAAEEENALVAL